MPDTSASSAKKIATANTKAVAEKLTSKAINYTELIPIVIKAIQEQQAVIDQQNEKIDALTQLVNKLSGNNGITTATLQDAFLALPHPTRLLPAPVSAMAFLKLPERPNWWCTMPQGKK